ncbi:MAG: hypothetical protein HRT58_10545 [Crocinitomicaceae bacterium]|nr:hypothetical protein [Flavobacteriales bacterium]NQZ36092.1 hypothetical protein [Crocinitomicaceae bacterium]
MKQSKIQTTILPLVGAVIIACGIVGCSEDPEVDSNIVDKEVLDLDGSLNSVFDGKIFSIPSPIQTAYLIQDLDLTFNDSMLNDDGNVSNYVTEYAQALNLGVYGADLGYVSIYEEKGSAMRYLTSIRKLTTKLGLEKAFDSDFISRFEASSEDQDSMILLMSDAFGQADNFLKKSDRKSVSALVLAGGWIESLYFSCELYDQKASEKMLRRIGEQRQTLNTLIDLLTEYNKGQKNDVLIADLKGLMSSFEKIELNYEYEAPETNEKERITTLRHRLTVKVTDAVLNEIRLKITSIRNNIIKA